VDWQVDANITSAPEDGDSVVLRNVGIDLQIHTEPKPKTPTIRSRVFFYVGCVQFSFEIYQLSMNRLLQAIARKKIVPDKY
jgi:hypothetical protein